MKKLFILLAAFCAGSVSAQESMKTSEELEINREAIAKSYNTEDQNKLVEEIASKVQENTEIGKRGYLILRNDTLGALVLGLSNKQIGYGAPVKFVISDEIKGTYGKNIEDMPKETKDKISGIPLSGVVSNYNLILPGLFVWIDEKENHENDENGQVIMISNDHPSNMQILILDKENENKVFNGATPGDYFLFEN